MPAIIDSAPDCISNDDRHDRGPGEDVADFVIGDLCATARAS